MKKTLAAKLASILILALFVVFFDLPSSKQQEIISYTPDWIKDSKVHLGLDLQGGTQLNYKIDLRKVPGDRQDEIVEGVRTTINRRVNKLGVSEPNIYTSEVGDEKHIIVELAGIKDIEEAKAIVGKTIQLEFKEEREEIETEDKEKVLAMANSAWDRIKQNNNFDQIIKEEEQAFPAKVTLNAPEKAYFLDEITPSKVGETIKDLNPGDISPVIEFADGDGEYSIGENGQLVALTGFAIYKIQEKNEVEREINHPKEVKVRHILVAMNQEEENARTEEEAKTRAQEVLVKIRNGDDFATLATEYSDDPGSAVEGGFLSDPVKENSIYVEEFEKASLALSNTGDTSDLVQTQFGFHIIKAEEIKEAFSEKKTEAQYKYSRILYSTIPDPWKDTSLTGKNFKLANVSFNNSYQPYVSIQFDDEGAELFEQLTENNINKRIAIFVGGELISAPMVREKIAGGQAQITGNFTVEEAQDLARDLNTGAIPAPIIITGQNTIGASLGADALNKSLKAGLIGLIILAIYMIAYYRFAGLLANIALFIYAALLLFLIKIAIPFALALGLSLIVFIAIVNKILKSNDSGWEKLISFLLACFVLFFLAFLLSTPVVLTLAGIAGIILSIGMAVDANVLIFERVKEERRAGHNYLRSVETGFDRAWTSIRDSNFSTLITCAILMYFGTSIIKGFAFNLSMGVLVSMFSAITITKVLLQSVAHKKCANKIFGNLKAKPRKKIAFIKNRKNLFIASATTLIICVLAIPILGLNLGLDFTGGSLMEIKFSQEVSNEQISSTLDSAQKVIADQKNTEAIEGEEIKEITADFGKAQIVSSGKNTHIIRLKYINNEAHDEIIKQLKTQHGEIEEIRFTTIGPVIGKTLKSKSLKALSLALIMIVLYIAFAFRKIPKRINPWRFGISALVALIHDIFITFGIFVILGKFIGIEIDTLIVTALLTILGYSVNDTIVVFDRIRENLKHQKRGDSFEDITNDSLNQTLTRSINTSLSTLFTITALFLFGALSIKYFVLALIIGAVLGTYSSIFIASPLLVEWKNWKK